ncbi:MAG: MFS transporter, partial [Deltaproteobacteria bacterium]|nr:MFS transporter [Deltaproteobacteria bacterium]
VNNQLVCSFAILFGIGWGVNAPIFVSSAADLFHGRSFGLIYGIMEGVLGIGGALGAWFPGFIYDQTHSYQLAFCFSIFMTILACLFIWLAAPSKAHNKGNMTGQDK